MKKHEKEASRMWSKSQRQAGMLTSMQVMCRCWTSLAADANAYRLSEVPKSRAPGSAVNAGLVYSINTTLQIHEYHDSIYSTGMQINTIFNFKISLAQTLLSNR